MRCENWRNEAVREQVLTARRAGSISLCPRDLFTADISAVLPNNQDETIEVFGKSLRGLTDGNTATSCRRDCMLEKNDRNVSESNDDNRPENILEHQLSLVSVFFLIAGVSIHK